MADLSDADNDAPKRIANPFMGAKPCDPPQRVMTAADFAAMERAADTLDGEAAASFRRFIASERARNANNEGVWRTECRLRGIDEERWRDVEAQAEWVRFT